MKDGGLTQKNYNLTRQSLPPHLSSDDPLSTQNEYMAIKTTVNTLARRVTMS